MISHSAGAGLPHRNPQTQTLVVNPGRPLPSSPGSAAGPITGLWGPFLGLQTGCCLQNQPLHPLSKHLPAGFFFFFSPPNTEICLSRAAGQTPSWTAQKVNFQALPKCVHYPVVCSSPRPTGISFFQNRTFMPLLCLLLSHL